MVYTATTDLTTSPQSIKTLLTAAGYNFSGGQTPRVTELKIQFVDGTPFIISNQTAAAGKIGWALDANTRTFELRQANANQISLDEIFVYGGAATDTVRIFAYQV